MEHGRTGCDGQGAPEVQETMPRPGKIPLASPRPRATCWTAASADGEATS